MSFTVQALKTPGSTPGAEHNRRPWPPAPGCGVDRTEAGRLPYPPPEVSHKRQECCDEQYR